jgi:hypothetical protein
MQFGEAEALSTEQPGCCAFGNVPDACAPEYNWAKRIRHMWWRLWMWDHALVGLSSGDLGTGPRAIASSDDELYAGGSYLNLRQTSYMIWYDAAMVCGFCSHPAVPAIGSPEPVSVLGGPKISLLLLVA